MKNLTEKTKASKLIETFALTILLATLCSCGPTFEDETSSIVMKPEILSIVLDPPEAAPGENVRASFLFADEKGPLTGVANFWLPEMPLDAGGLDFEKSLSEASYDLTDLIMPEFTYRLAEADELEFDDTGMTQKTLSLLVASDNSQKELDFQNMEQAISDGSARIAIRSLMISKREEKNRNPRIKSIRLVRDDGSEEELTLVHHWGENLTQLRKTAAASAIKVKEASEVSFVATVEDEGDTEDALRYSWVSTDGDFMGRKDKNQPFTAPDYVTVSTESDQEAVEDPDDPRLDPNLRPVWLIVRDNGVEEQFGQSWAEFYIEVVK